MYFWCQEELLHTTSCLGSPLCHIMLTLIRKRCAGDSITMHGEQVIAWHSTCITQQTAGLACASSFSSSRYAWHVIPCLSQILQLGRVKRPLPGQHLESSQPSRHCPAKL